MAANVILRDGLAVTAEALEHDVRQERVLHRAIHDIERHHRPEDAGGDFDGREMAAHQDGAAALGKRRLQMMQTLDIGELVEAPIAAPPGIGGFTQRHAETAAMPAQQILALRLRESSGRHSAIFRRAIRT